MVSVNTARVVRQPSGDSPERTRTSGPLSQLLGVSGMHRRDEGDYGIGRLSIGWKTPAQMALHLLKACVERLAQGEGVNETPRWNKKGMV